MNKIIYITIGALAIAVIALAIGFSTKTPIVNVNPELRLSDEAMGAIPGTSVDSNYFSIGGLKGYYTSISMNRGTTTVCSIKAPNASSTLVYMTVEFTTSSSTATEVQIAKARRNTSTTTLLSGILAIGAGEKAYFRASTTPDTIGTQENKLTFTAGADYLNVNMVGDKQGNSALKAPVGSCNALFYLNN